MVRGRSLASGLPLARATNDNHASTRSRGRRFVGFAVCVDVLAVVFDVSHVRALAGGGFDEGEEAALAVGHEELEVVGA